MFISPLTLLPGSRQCFLFFVTKSQNLVMNRSFYVFFLHNYIDLTHLYPFRIAVEMKMTVRRYIFL
jgi:hypothetical protein